MINEIKNIILDILDKSGIYIDPTEMNEDLDLREYILDSLQYVYFIVELEERLQIELEDEILLYDNLSSINGFVNMIINMIQDIPHQPDNNADIEYNEPATGMGNVINMSNC